MTRYRSLLACFVVPVTLAIAGCSGGGDDGGGGASGPRTNACDVLGLKIINGTPCREANSPVVGFEVEYSNREPTLCSGTMISSEDVLTAAHCFLDGGRNVTKISVKAGGEQVPAADFAIHPQFREGPEDKIPQGVALFNDVAILKLIRPVSVPTVPILSTAPVVKGDIVAIFGYGLDENNNLGTLESGEMEVDAVTSDLIIADFQGEGSNTCVGDSGGPAILQFLDVDGVLVTGVVGITSSGDARSLCKKGDTSTFTNIQGGSNLSFIRTLVPSVGVN